MYKDLSLKEKSELFKLMVSNGITDINEIEKIYNSYSDGRYLSYMEEDNRTKKYLDNTPEYISDTYNKYQYGGTINKFDGTSTKTQQMQTMEKPAFFEGDSWKPQYWFTPNYETPTLKDAIMQAYDDGRRGKNIMWNGKAYEASLNPEEEKQWRASRGISINQLNRGDISAKNLPRNVVQNEYLPIKMGDDTFYYDTFTTNFYLDNKGNTQINDPNNDLLYNYYSQYIDPLRSSNNYADIVKMHVQQMRNLQKKRRIAALEQDLPEDYKDRGIVITTGKSGSSRLKYPTDLIDSLYRHLPKGMNIYTALAMPYQETDFGHNRNFDRDWMGERGTALSTLNDERYELPGQTFYSHLDHAIDTYFKSRSKKGKDGKYKVDGMTKKEFKNKYYRHRGDDLLDIELLHNEDMLNFVGEELKKNMFYKTFKNDILTNRKEAPNIYEHALQILAEGKYNPGQSNYNEIIQKSANELRKDPELSKYLKHKKQKQKENIFWNLQD